MTDAKPGDPAQGPDGEQPPDSPPGGIFAKLPSSRPGLRSPTRDAARARDRSARDERAAGPARAPSAQRGSQAPGEPAEPPRGEPRPDPEDAPQTGPAHEAGLGDVAWAGVATVAEAATLGVRLAGRALEAVRGAVERR